MKKLIAASALLLGCHVHANAKPREITRLMIGREELANLPGYETRMYLIEFPPGAVSNPHIHSTPGVGYVVEGSFEASYDDGPPLTKHAGEAFVDLPNRVHNFRNPDPSRWLRFVVAGTYRQDEELSKPAP
jgi:quercetin dioxygenase-like cupin family protein